MIEAKVFGNRVIFGPVRLSYTYLNEPYKAKDDNSNNPGKYMTNALIPKGETQTVEAIRAAIQAAIAKGMAKLWNNKMPKKFDDGLRDGDEREKDLDLYGDHFYINAKSARRPGVLDRYHQPITNPDDIYSGMWALLSVSFFPYSNNGANGIACGLDNVLKVRDGEPLNGRSSAMNDFAGIELDDDDDLGL